MRTTSGSLKDICKLDSMSSCTQTGFRYDENADDDDMCQIDDKDDFMINSIKKPSPLSNLDDMNKSFNPMCEPDDDWSSKFNETTKLEENASGANRDSCVIMDSEFTFPSEPLAETTTMKSHNPRLENFWMKRLWDLKWIQSPLYEFYNTLNSASAISFGAIETDNVASKSPSPHRVPSRRQSTAVDAKTASPGCRTKGAFDNALDEESLTETQLPPQLPDGKAFEVKQGTLHSSRGFSERQRKRKEELDEELWRQREMLRQARRGK